MGMIFHDEANREYWEFAWWLSRRTRSTDETLFWLEFLNRWLSYIKA